MPYLDKFTTEGATLMTEDYTEKWWQVEQRFSLTATLALVGSSTKRLTEDQIRCGYIDEVPWFFNAANAGNDDANDKDLEVDSLDGLRIGQLVHNIRTGEIALITAIDTGTSTLTITRGTASTTGGNKAAWLEGDVWIAGTTPTDEGWTDLPTAVMQVPTPYTNYIQQMVEPILFTGREERLMKNGSMQFGRTRQEVIDAAKVLLRRQQAISLLWGKKASTTGGNGLPNTKTGGLTQFASYVWDPTVDLNLDQEKTFEDALDQITTYCKSGRLMLACDYYAYQALTRLYQNGSWGSFNEIITKVGIKLKSIASINNVELIPYRDPLVPSYKNAAGNTRGQFFAWDPNEVEWVGTSAIGIYDFHTNMGDNTTLYWMAEGGWKFRNTNSIGWYRGVVPVTT